MHTINAGSGKIESKISVKQGIYSGIQSSRNTFYFGAGNIFYSVSSGGKVLWDVPVDSDIKTIPDISNNLAVFSSEKGVVYCLELKDRKQKWKFVWHNPIYTKAITISKNTTFVGDEYGAILDLYYK